MILVIASLCGGCSDEFEPIGNIDPDVPFPVTDLAITTSNDTTYLVWTATGDDGPNGTATRYDLRRHAEAITDENWHDAMPVEGVPSPGPSGTRERFVLAAGETGLTTMFYALKVVDDVGNTSKMSNVAFVDLLPPDPVVDLAAVRVTDSYARLSWTAPVDGGPLGHAARYEIRLANAMLTEENWNDAPPLNGPSQPAEAGETQLFNLIELAPLTEYYVALRSRDEADNLSDLSNVIRFTTPARPLGWWDGFAGLDFSSGVGVLHVHNDTLFVGGRFNGVEGVGSRGLVSYDGTNWHGYNNGFAGGQWGTSVYRMESFGGDLYIGGMFTWAGGVPVNNIARWTGTGFESLGNPASAGAPTSMKVFQGNLHIAWGITQSSTPPYDCFNYYDGTSFHSLDWLADRSPFIPDMEVYDGRLAMVGSLEGPAGLTGESVILWDGSGWSQPGPDFAGGRFAPTPYSACVYQGDLIVAGDFSHVGEKAVNNIARWDGSAWHDLAGGLGGGENLMVNDMVVYRDQLVVTGRFETAGGRVVNNIARWDGGYWEPMGTGLAAPGQEYFGGGTLAVYQGSLYVGGTFTEVDGKPSRYLARWDLD